jgi:hypothetical protein
VENADARLAAVLLDDPRVDPVACRALNLALRRPSPLSCTVVRLLLADPRVQAAGEFPTAAEVQCLPLAAAAWIREARRTWRRAPWLRACSCAHNTRTREWRAGQP